MDDLPISKSDHQHEANLAKKSDTLEIVPPSLKEEASLRRKFDVFLLPPLALMLVIQSSLELRVLH